ncbi:MAG: hypothetical protein H8E39_03305 [Alphaproteobacteria bacterium]|nr:hypothetical protein [Alphaproteobacteria bacterium]
MTATEALPTGLPFVQMLGFLLGVTFTVLGLVLWAMEGGQDEASSKLRHKMAAGWRGMSSLAWTRVPLAATGWLIARIDGWVRIGFEEADRGIAFGGIVLFLLFVILPVLALVNMLTGGSPFLFMYYLSLLAALAFLNFSGETGYLKILNALIAGYLGLSLIAVIPIYVLRAFSEVSIHNVFSHAVLKSPLVAVFWYVAAYGVRVMFDLLVWMVGGRFQTRPFGFFIHAVLAATPLAFVLTFAALLAGHLAVFDQAPVRSWTLLLISTGLTAVSFPAVFGMVALSAREETEGLGLFWALALGLILSTMVSVLAAYGLHFGTGQALSWTEAVNVLIGLSPDGKQIYLGPDFWLMHLPFLPWLMVVFVMIAGVAGKGIAALSSRIGVDTGVEKQPFLASAMLSGAFASVSYALFFTL